MSIYKLKSSFQNLLRPLVGRLAAMGVTANQVTLIAAIVSVGIGALLLVNPAPALFALVPVWMLLRMGLNAIDGMLARQHAVDGVESHAQQHPHRNEREKGRRGVDDEKRADRHRDEGGDQRHLVGRDTNGRKLSHQGTKQVLEG